MKTGLASLLTMVMLVASAEAHSESLVIAKVRSIPRIPNGAALLDFRHDFNRAWVSATLCNKYVTSDWAASDCRPYNQYKIRVAGLVYDPSLGAIRFGRHVCAWVEDGPLAPISRETGDCKLDIHSVGESLDNGYEGSWRPMDLITIQFRNSRYSSY